MSDSHRNSLVLEEELANLSVLKFAWYNNARPIVTTIRAGSRQLAHLMAQRVRAISWLACMDTCIMHKEHSPVVQIFQCFVTILYIIEHLMQQHR
jgi:hypothetical protein